MQLSLPLHPLCVSESSHYLTYILNSLPESAVVSKTLMGVQKVLLVPQGLCWVQWPCLWHRSAGFWLWGHLGPGQGSRWGTDGVCSCCYSLPSHPDSAGAAIAAGGGWGAQAAVPTAAIAVSTTQYLGGHHKVYTYHHMLITEK